MREIAMMSWLHPGSSVMEMRRRFKQVVSLKDRLIQQAQNLRRQAEQMPPGVRRDELMKKARQAETTAHVDDWLSSPGLRPPH
jgi:uncharacterized coiled-coil DUF342 family protein